MGKKKLAKLLYFVDFTSQELQDKPVTGLRYEKWQYGPVPSNYYDILDRMTAAGQISIKNREAEYTPARITTTKSPDYSVFDENELRVINSITERFRYSTAKMVESLAKEEPPYKMVGVDEEIPYHLAYYRNSFDEMTLDENTDSPTSEE